MDPNIGDIIEISKMHWIDSKRFKKNLLNSKRNNNNNKEEA